MLDAREAKSGEPATRLDSGTPVWVDGEGPTLVLVHGVLMDHRMWDAQVAALVPDYRVVRYDMLGHGSAPDPAGPRCLDDFVEQAHEVVSAFCDGPRPVLAGFSMGGLIAQAYGIRHGDALRGLIMLNAVYDRSDAERAAVLARLRLMQDQGVQSVIQAAAQRWFDERERREMGAQIAQVLGWIREGAFAPKVKAYEVFATGDQQTAGRLHAIRTPVLVMTGEGDVGSPPHMSQKIAAEITAARLLVLNGQRHMMPVLDAKRVNAALRAFLDSLKVQ